MIALLVRQFRASPWPTLLLAFTVAVLSLIATIIPRMSTQLDDRQLTSSLRDVSAVQGDVSGTWTTYSVGPLAAGDPWQGPREAAETTRLAQPEPLRSLLRPAQFLGTQPVRAEWVPPTETGYYRVDANLLIDPDLPDWTSLVEGAWPEIGSESAPFQVAMLQTFAEKANLKVGDRPTPNLQITGIFTANHPEDTRWDHNPYAARISEEVSPAEGTKLVGGLFMAPDMAAGDPSMRLQDPFRYDVYFGLNADAVAAQGTDIAALSAQLTGMLAKRWSPVPAPLGDEPVGADNNPMAFHSDLNSLLERQLAQQRTTHTLIAVSAIGPLGVGIALVTLCAQLVLYRRRTAITLLSARGMSPAQLRGLVAIEGAVAGVPAAVLGHLVGRALVEAPNPWWSWPLTLAVGLVPAAALAWVARDTSHLGRREVASSSSRWRTVAEILIALAAGGATWRLLTTKGTQGVGTDLLGAAAPVLLTLLACLLVLRVYPVPLRLLVHAFKRGRGFTGFMGSARALREPAGGVAPVVTIVLGTTIAVTAASLLGTISAGTERAVWNENGSSVHVSGPRMTEETAEQLRAIDGVAAVALVRLGSDNSALRIGDTEVRARVWLADANLAETYLASKDGSPLPAAVFQEGSPVPVVVGGALIPAGGKATLQGLGDVDVVGRLQLLPGVTSADAWVLVSTDNWPEKNLTSAKTAIISAAPGADLEAVTAAVKELIPLAHVTTTDTQLQALRDSPTVDGLSRIFILLTLITGVLMVLAIFTAQVMTANDRRSAAAVLRTLGLTPGQLRALTAWELGPVVLVALILGALVGIGVAALMLATVDFTALTGGVFTPSLYLDPRWVGGVCLALLAATTLAVGFSAWLAGRTNIAHELRLGEER